MNKRGEPTMSFYLITTILAIIGFTITIIFLLGLDITKTSEDEVCRISVLSRATAPDSAANYIPLKCTTEKICITTGPDCPEFLGEKENARDPIKISDDINDVKKSAEIIEKTIADSMLKCWSMMGEGKLSLFSKGVKNELGMNPDELTCVICDRIAFNIPDQKLKETIFRTVNIEEYMKTKKPSESSQHTYMAIFTDKSANPIPVVTETPELRAAVEKIEQSNKKLEGATTDQLAIVFSQIRAGSYKEKLSTLGVLGVTTAGSVYFSAGIGKIASKLLINGPGLALIGITSIGITAISISNTYQGRVAAAGYCGALTTSDPDSKEGCSGIQVVPYEFRALNDICVGIEGNP